VKNFTHDHFIWPKLYTTLILLTVEFTKII